MPHETVMHLIGSDANIVALETVITFLYLISDAWEKLTCLSSSSKTMFAPTLPQQLRDVLSFRLR